MNKDWIQFTSGPLSLLERHHLLEEVWKRHKLGALKNVNNASNQAVRNAAPCSLNLAQSLASGILALGGLHGAVTQARRVLFHQTPRNLNKGERVPGMGNSFYRDQIDPVWQGLAEFIEKNHPEIWGKILAWQEQLRKQGKTLYPNPAALTAAVAELVGWPVGAELILLVEPRMAVWTAIHVETVGNITILQ